MDIDDTLRVAHPVSAAVAMVSDTLAAAAGVPVWSLTEGEVRDTLGALTAAKAQLAELELRVARQAVIDGAGGTTGATSTAAWWAEETRQVTSECLGLVKLAASLDTATHEPVRAAMAAGAVRLDQARVIVAAVDALPDDLVPAAVREEARDCLIGLAKDHDARQLRRLGARILEVVAPDIAEQAEADALDREEERARQGTRLTMSDDGHGLTLGRFAIPTEIADRLRTALAAIAAPKHQAATAAAARETAPAEPDASAPVEAPATGRRTAPLRMGQAFCELIGRYPTERLPQAGGAPAAVTVTMSLETLRGGLAPATLDTGTRISAGRARMLACEAGIIPAVLGGASEVLDLGRARRLFSTAQRRVLEVTQRHCTARGCDWPPGMCHAHHDVPWSHGGPTDVRNGRLLCPRHHARIHDPHYKTTRHLDGSVTFHRRT